MCGVLDGCGPPSHVTCGTSLQGYKPPYQRYWIALQKVQSLRKGISHKVKIDCCSWGHWDTDYKALVILMVAKGLRNKTHLGF